VLEVVRSGLAAPPDPASRDAPLTDPTSRASRAAGSSLSGRAGLRTRRLAAMRPAEARRRGKRGSRATLGGGAAGRRWKEQGAPPRIRVRRRSLVGAGGAGAPPRIRARCRSLGGPPPAREGEAAAAHPPCRRRRREVGWEEREER
jgi:hypothetical protein